MSNLDIAERRLPQGRPDRAGDRRQPGRHPGLDPGRPCSARASSCGSSTGRSSTSTSTRSAWPRTSCSPPGGTVIYKPNGIILVTGPTSSGKTTTLYATLNELNTVHGQDHHDRGAGRVRHRRADPGAHQQRDRRDLRRLPPGHPPAGPGQDPRRRDPRPGDGRDLDPGVVDRSHRVHDPAHQRRPVGDHPAPRHGPADVPHHGHRRGRAGPAARPEDLQSSARPSSRPAPRSRWSWG